MAREPETSSAVDQVRSFVEELDERIADGGGVWLMGDTGTGKTSLAMLMCKEARQRDFSVAIYSVPKLLAHIRRTFDAPPGQDNYLSFFERLTSVDLLLLDDLGTENRTEWVLEQLYALVNERYEHQRSVLVTSNVPLDPHGKVNEMERIKAEVGVRTYSRLMEMCGEPIPLFGEDRREDTRHKLRPVDSSPR